jgi:DNA (cytosine-5)-methyltransferase 1
LKYLDLFSGAGGFRSAFEQIPGTECVGHCEIDVHADKSYRALFHTEGEWFCNDARQIDTAGLPDFDLVCGGFPCQSFSIAGHRKGFEDTRGTLFFEIARILKARKPPFVLLENVPGLLSHDEGRTFAVILGTLSRLGYHVEWQVLNSKDFGVPQSRQRVFIVGYLGAGCAGKILPILGTNGASLIQVLGGAQGLRVYDPEGIACTQAAQAGGMGGKTGLYAVGFNRKDGITHGLKEAYALNASNFRGLNRNQSQTAVLKTDDASFIDLCAGNPKLTDTARCVTANYGKTTLCYHKGERSGVLETDGVLLIKEATKCGFKPANIGDTVDLSYATSNTRRGRVGRDIAHTLDTGSTQGVVTLSGRIRKLTPRECFRLQGYRENQIDKILAITSDSQAYKQAGNGVTVNVVYAIGLKIKAAWDELYGAGGAK